MTDTELLDWIADNELIEGVSIVDDDIHTLASEIAGENVTTREHHRAALRVLLTRAKEASE